MRLAVTVGGGFVVRRALAQDCSRIRQRLGRPIVIGLVEGRAGGGTSGLDLGFGKPVPRAERAAVT
jgi:hypothetical protein